MQPVPTIPDNAPFTPDQRAWLNGFLAGLFSQRPAGGSLESAPGAAPARTLTILYGSETGTAEGLAKKAGKVAGGRGFAVKVKSLAEVTPASLRDEPRVLLLTSTFGDGEPPANAKAFYDALHAPDAPRLEGLQFSVLALGDTNYAQFCKCGADLDNRLQALGAKSVAPRVNCDTDYEAHYKSWLDAALGALSSGEAAPRSSTSEPADAAPEGTLPRYGKHNPFPAQLVRNLNLNGAGSSKETRHLEFILTGSDLEYAAGDALGVMPQNAPELVGQLLGALGCDGEEAVSRPDGQETSLRRALVESYEISRLNPQLVTAWAERSQHPELLELTSAGKDGALRLWMHGRDLLDLCLSHPIRFERAGELTVLLKKLAPRLYSISSSPKAHPGEVHLTVGAVRLDFHGRARGGVCSTYLADRCPSGSKVGVFVHHNPNFRPPADAARPMIMVGPGTGIAPFRAFLEERQATGARGRNWLLFGDQKSSTDFLYREELEAMQRSGHLSRLDLAFSRDQADKIYVQDRLRAAGAELWKWLEAGAHFYICGDASRMAKDVDRALRDIVATHGRKSEEDANAYVDALLKEKRYARDVY